jgi:hypothetical protein
MVDALTIWVLVTAPVILLGRTRFLFALWLLALLGVHFSWAAELGLDTPWVLVGWAITPAFFFLGFGHLSEVQKRRAALADCATTVGLLGLVWAASILSHQSMVTALINDTDNRPLIALFILALCCVLATPAVLHWRRSSPPQLFAIQARFLSACLLSIFGVYFLGCVAGAPEHLKDTFDGWSLLRFASIGSYLFLWFTIAWWAAHARRLWLHTAAIIAITGRMLVIFVTVFSSMLGTGLVFIAGGIVTIGAVAFISQRHRMMRDEIKEGEGAA